LSLSSLSQVTLRRSHTNVKPDRTVFTTSTHVNVQKEIRLGRMLPRSSQWTRLRRQPDPVGLLESQLSRASRARPATAACSPRRSLSFAGAAEVIAHDLESTLSTQLCGDAHLSNSVASPLATATLSSISTTSTKRFLPFEWDVKRLAARFEIRPNRATLSA
jgi:hypothetical protein